MMIVITGDEEKGDDGKDSMAVTMAEALFPKQSPGPVTINTCSIY